MTIKNLRDAEFDICKVQDYLNENKCVAIIWTIDDVKSVRPDLDDEQCYAVLQEYQQGYDCNANGDWDALETHAEELFPA